MKRIAKPTDDIPSFYQHYMDHVPDDGNLISHLEEILIETKELVKTLSEDTLLYRYAKDKWTIKDVLVHLSDCERIIVYRAARIARGDKTNLPAFDENLFAANAHANDRNVDDIMKELSAFRGASIAFIETLDEESLDRTGTANGYPLSTRLLVNHLYGHHKHHLTIIREKYLK
jgi:uncharacterized damage-inducible protein DinB